MKSENIKKYIYINDILRNVYTEQPLLKYPNTSHTYVSNDVIKEVLSEKEFNELNTKIRAYGTSLENKQE